MYEIGLFVPIGLLLVSKFEFGIEYFTLRCESKSCLIQFQKNKKNLKENAWTNKKHLMSCLLDMHIDKSTCHKLPV